MSQPPTWGTSQPNWAPPPPQDNTRKTAGIILAAILGVVVLGAILISTVGSDSSSGSTAKPETASSKTASPSNLDDAGKLACDDFAHGYKAADTKTERLDLAHKVNKWAPSSKTDRIADTGHVLANGAAGSDSAWQLAADTFAQACLDAGWKA